MKFKEAEKYMVDNCYILLDDTFYREKEYDGKGGKVMNTLDKKYLIIEENKATKNHWEGYVLLKRVS